MRSNRHCDVMGVTASPHPACPQWHPEGLALRHSWAAQLAASGTLRGMSSGATDHTTDSGKEAIEVVIDGFRTLSTASAPLVDARAAMVGVTWMIRILRTAEAMIAVYDQGLGDTAPPLSRSIIEHSISLMWLSERREEAVKAVEYGHRKHQRNVFKSAAEGEWDLAALDVDGETHVMNNKMPVPEDWPRFNWIEQRIPAKQFPAWYTTYRLESALSHATYLSGAVYASRRKEVEFHWEPQIPATPLRGAAVFVVLAAEALTELVETSKTFKAALADAATFLGLRPNEGTELPPTG